MAYQLSVVQQYSVAGKNYNLQQVINAPRLDSLEELCPVAWDSALTTRTSNTVGVLTMVNPAHLITTASLVDLYWLDTTGQIQLSAHNVTIGTVSGVTVPFTIPTDAGFPETVLPTLVGTDIIVALIQSFTTSIIGNNVVALVGSADVAAATIILGDAVPSEDLVMNIVPNGNYGWLGVGTNPLAGKTVTTVKMSHNSITTPTNVRIAALLSA